MKQIEIVKKVNAFGRGTWLDTASLIISSSYFLVPLYLLINVLVFFYADQIKWTILIAMALALAIHFLTNEIIIKKILSRFYSAPRPFMIDSKIQTIGDKIYNSTFPSGHVSSITAFLTVLILYYPTFWPLALVFIILIGLSRMHNGLHYPADVIGGLILGIGYGFLAIFLANKILPS